MLLQIDSLAGFPSLPTLRVLNLARNCLTKLGEGKPRLSHSN